MSSFSQEYLLNLKQFQLLKLAKSLKILWVIGVRSGSVTTNKNGELKHKLYHPMWNAPDNSKLYLELRAESSNKMIIGLDEFVTELNIHGSNKWQSYTLSPSDFKNFQMISKRIGKVSKN